MKKLILIIGAVALAAAVIHAADLTIVGAEVTAKTTLSAGTAGALMSQASIAQGTIRVAGTNVYITGMATIKLPIQAIASIVDLPPGVSVTNLIGGTFQKGTNGAGVDIVVKFRE